jgi:hypothetical protein
MGRANRCSALASLRTFLSPHLTTYGVRCGERKGGKKVEGRGGIGGEGKNSALFLMSPLFFYSYIYFIYNLFSTLILLFLSPPLSFTSPNCIVRCGERKGRIEKVEEEAKQPPTVR